MTLPNSQIPTREILWNVEPVFVGLLYLLCAGAGLWIAYWFFRRSRLWSVGKTAFSEINVKEGVIRLARYLLTHRTLAKDPYAGVMHFLIFWGFFIELVATTLVAVQHHFDLIFLTGTTYLIFSLVSDLGGVALGIGLGMALWRRRSVASRGRLQQNGSITALLWLLLAITVSGFFLEASRIATSFPTFERWSVAAYPLARVMAGLGIGAESAVQLHHLFWLSHAAIVIGFFVFIPLSLMRHIFLGAYSVMRPTGQPGQFQAAASLFPVPIQLPSFRQIDLLHADACLTCGRCTEVCPAQAAGKPLSPRNVVLGLRGYLKAPSGAENIAAYISDDSIWSCTTCHACDTACPIDIRIVDKIAMVRRARVLEGSLADTANEALESTAQRFNPFGKANSSRLEWAEGLDIQVTKSDEEPVELLYWVGCAGAFDPAGREVARAMIKILNTLKVSYRVLGTQERCTGDPARRLGEEGLWRELASSNRTTFQNHQVKTILTNCPHCLNSFKNEYTSLGEMPQVIHHSQWLRQHLENGTLKMSQVSAERITFHDPCYLSRANNEIDAPRSILSAVSSKPSSEMEASGAQSFCCGGGGGQLWLDVRGDRRVETIRASHVEKTGAQTVATGCPFCRVMLEAGRGGLAEGEGKWRVKDIAELVIENLGGL